MTGGLPKYACGPCLGSCSEYSLTCHFLSVHNVLYPTVHQPLAFCVVDGVGKVPSRGFVDYSVEYEAENWLVSILRLAFNWRLQVVITPD